MLTTVIASFMRSTVKMGKAMCRLDSLIGQYYGIQFELAADGQTLVFKRTKLERWAHVGALLILHLVYMSLCRGLSETLLHHGLMLLTRDDVAPVDKMDANGTMNKNNSELLDRGDANQNLKAKDIEAMREAGMGGEAIVEALLTNSETYESKTLFAQVVITLPITSITVNYFPPNTFLILCNWETGLVHQYGIVPASSRLAKAVETMSAIAVHMQAKYRKRKADKYMAQATLIRPTARSVAEAYFGKSPQKIQCMRADTLALLLSLANIGAHARVLVVETCGGLVTGAIAERMGGTGLVRACTSLGCTCRCNQQ